MNHSHIRETNKLQVILIYIIKHNIIEKYFDIAQLVSCSVGI